MPIINPNVKLNYLPVADVWAKLERLDKIATYNFLVNPTSIRKDHRSNFNKLQVLKTGQPQLVYTGSESVLSVPEVLFYTNHNSGDLATTLTNISNMTKPGVGDPPLLTLSWGNVIEARLYLESFGVTETQWRSGKVTMAVGSMAFLLVPEVIVKPPETLLDKILTKLSPKEQDQNLKKVLEKANADPKWAKEMGIVKGVIVNVTEQGKVILKNPQGVIKQLGGLKDVLGSVKSSLSNL